MAWSVRSVRAQQTWLFPWRNPLGERVGAEFFQELPALPGVYQMMNREAEVIYVGQSSSLRQRVNSYRYITQNHPQRRLVRLVSQVVAISVEIHDSGEEAIAREKELIRRYRPRFNRAHNQARARACLGFFGGDTGVFIRWAQAPEKTVDWPEQGQRWPALGQQFLAMTLLALHRQMWRFDYRDWTMANFPWGAFGKRPPAELRLPPTWQCEQRAAWIEGFLSGRDDTLLAQLDFEPAAREDIDDSRSWIRRDLELLEGFFEHQARRQ